MSPDQAAADCAGASVFGRPARQRVPCNRLLATLEIRHEDRYEKAGQCFREGDELGGVRQLRQQLGWDERSDLDLVLPGRVGVADPLDLLRGRKYALNRLQSIAKADFADDDVSGKAGGRLRHGDVSFA